MFCLGGLEKPLWPGILARPELKKGGAPSALVGHFALIVESIKKGCGDGPGKCYRMLQVPLAFSG